MSLEQAFSSLLHETEQARANAKMPEQIQAIRIEVLGRKGKLAQLFGQLQSCSPEERKSIGQTANAVKEKLEALLFEEKNGAIGETSLHTWSNMRDRNGHLHPLTIFLRKVLSIFESMGYDIIDSPELESEQYNFDLLNIPKDHPARDQWDTFFVRRPGQKSDALLRTHTSPMQIRGMIGRKPPVRIAVPGRVFRHEASDSTHGSCFFNIEGFAIDTKLSLADLIGTLTTFLQSIYGKDIRVRFRPSFFPFVEPGMEVDMQFSKMSKGEPRWLEMLGSGMIHPKVLSNMGVDPEKYSGFAFGLGMDRLAMGYWGIDHIKYLYSGNYEFGKQF